MVAKFLFFTLRSRPDLTLDYRRCRFLLGASRFEQLPADTGTEVAFAGRAFHEIVIQQDAQGLPSRSINFGEAITGQVRYTRLIGYLEQVDFPGAAWCFAGAGQFFLSGYHVEYAGFPGV